jgi:hypothetical protein
MTARHRLLVRLAGEIAVAAPLLLTQAAAKPGLQVIYQMPVSGDPLIATFANSDGSVFVETPLGPNTHGQILLLTPNGKKYTASVLKAFACDTDGSVPSGCFVGDPSGNVWGMMNSTCGGDGTTVGTIFELVKPQKGGAWTFRTALQMPNTIGLHGVAGSGFEGMAFDKTGNLDVLVALGCEAEYGCGKIIKVPSGALDGSKPKAKIATLYMFPTTDQAAPTGLARDKFGNLFGTEYASAPYPYGSVWALTPPSEKKASWSFQTLHQFCVSGNCTDGYGPQGLLATDKHGNVFGTTLAGGVNGGVGTIYTLSASSGGWAFATLHVLSDPGTQCQSTTDHGVAQPVWNTLLEKSGQILTAVNQGGFFNPCGDFQTMIRGGFISVDPSSGADAIVNNQFAALEHVSGPFNIGSSPSIAGDTIFGTSQQYYDAATDSLSPGVVFKISQ